ncbi:unnamed protein product [Musa acuminata var. zebrina]
MSRWYRNVVFHLKRAWYAVSCCLRSPRQGEHSPICTLAVLPPSVPPLTACAERREKRSSRGILELHDEVQTCEYEDVQVMWDMLTKPVMETETETETVANQAEEPIMSEAVVVKKAEELLETTKEILEKALD